MTQIRCTYIKNGENEISLRSWLQKNDNRYLICLGEAPINDPNLNSHPRIRFIDLQQKHLNFHIQQVIEEFLFFPFTFDFPDHPLMKQFSKQHSQLNFQSADYSDQGIQLLKNFHFHLQKPTYFFRHLYNSFKGVPALICGGSPSLMEQESELIRLQDSALIFGCGSGIEALLKMKITPHAAVHIDPNSLHTFTPCDVPLFYQLRTCPKVASCYKGPRFLVEGPGNFPLETELQMELDLDPMMDGGWTSATFGVKIATLLGCNPIILVGNDFSSSSHQIYAKGITTQVPQELFFSVINRQGNRVLTRSDWIFATEWLNDFALLDPELKLSTTSFQGLSIPQIPLSSLQDLPLSKGITIQAQTLFQNQSLIDGKPHWDRFITSLYHSQQLIKQILQQIETIFPQNPNQHSTYILLDHELSQEIACEWFLEPIWQKWKPNVMRHLPKEGQEIVGIVNRLLFFQSICDKSHVFTS